MPRRPRTALRKRNRRPRPASIVGAGDTTLQAAPARVARSSSTSRACQVGTRSSCNASSASSTTTALARSGTGASAAMRPPTTTHPPAAARRHASVRGAAARSECSSATIRPRPASQRASEPARWPSATHTIDDPSTARRDSTSSRRSCNGGTRITRGAGATADERAAGQSTVCTLFAGDAERKTATRGPAHRHAIHSLSATTSVGGPTEATASIGNNFVSASTSGVTSSATTHPRTRRPCSGARTIVPTRTRAANSSGTR